MTTKNNLPAEQPTEHQKATNQWWFPTGTKLRAKEHPISPNIAEGETYTVVRDPWLDHEDHDSWSIEVQDVHGEIRVARVVEFVRHAP